MLKAVTTASVVSSAYALGAPSILPGMSSMGQSLNLLTLENRAAVLEHTFATNKTIQLDSGEEFLVPDGATVNLEWQCEEEASASMTTTFQSYVEAHSSSIGVDAKFKQFVASASASASEAHEQMSWYSAAVTQSLLKCVVYDVHLMSGSLGEDVEAAIAALPEAYSNDSSAAYAAFLGEWGTHAATRCQLGGQVSQQASVEKSYWSLTDEKTVSVQAAASLIVGVDASSSKSKDVTQEFLDATSFSSHVVSGGTWPSDNSTWADWAASIENLEHLVCASAELTSVADLMTESWTSDDAVLARAAAMAAAVLDFVSVEGCTDPSYPNYDPAATVDDGSCECSHVDVTQPECPDGATELGPWALAFDTSAEEGYGRSHNSTVACVVPGADDNGFCWISVAYAHDPENAAATAEGLPAVAGRDELTVVALRSADFCGKHDDAHEVTGSTLEYPSTLKCVSGSEWNNHGCDVEAPVTVGRDITAYVSQRDHTTHAHPHGCEFAAYAAVLQAAPGK